jgi:hypothetical protein
LLERLAPRQLTTNARHHRIPDPNKEPGHFRKEERQWPYPIQHRYWGFLGAKLSSGAEHMHIGVDRLAF